MSFTSNIKSIAWSTSLVGGKLGNFAGKTSEDFSKSFPTISFMGSFIGSCTLMVNNFSSFCIYFLSCLVESKKVLGKFCILVSSKAEPLGFVQ